MKLFKVANKGKREVNIIARTDNHARDIAASFGLVKDPENARVSEIFGTVTTLGYNDIDEMIPGIVTDESDGRLSVYNPVTEQTNKYSFGSPPKPKSPPEAETEPPLNEPYHRRIKLTGFKDKFDATLLSKAFTKLGATYPTEDETMQARLWYRRGRSDYAAMAAELIVAREQTVETATAAEPTTSRDPHAGRITAMSPALAAPYGEQPKGHVHAAHMKAYAEDATETAEPWPRWEERNWDEPTWHPCLTHPQWNPLMEYRRKPQIVSINGIDVPKPETHALRKHTDYYVPNLGTADFDRRLWTEHPEDFARLNRGLVHRTPEAARLHCAALLTFTVVNQRGDR